MPYIPPIHEKYDLLPRCRANGGEVFDYPSALLEAAEALVDAPQELAPYNFSCYDKYYRYLDEQIKAYSSRPEVADMLTRLKQRVMERNQKAEWSVLKYVGPTTDASFGLTHGKNYYWPTCKSHPKYCGVIDNEEFTSYLYPTDPHLWEILEDPTGMAYRTIYAGGEGHMSTEEYNAMMTQINRLASDTLQ